MCEIRLFFYNEEPNMIGVKLKLDIKYTINKTIKFTIKIKRYTIYYKM